MVKLAGRITLIATSLLSFSTPSLAADQPQEFKKQAAREAPFFFVNDNFLTYDHIFTGTEVAVGKTAKDDLAFTHFDAWSHGTNFLNLVVTQSGRGDPANPCTVPFQGCEGKTKFYGVLRSTFGLNQIFDTKSFTAGALRNVSIEVGADLSTENDAIASAKKAIMSGLQFAFDLPYKGYFNVAPMAYKEFNYNRFTFFPPTNSITGSVEFDTTWAVETNYYLPLGFLPDSVPLSISGYNNFYGPKGTGAPRQLETKTEFKNEQRVTLDVSKMIWNKSHFLDYWVAYRVWKNKYGVDGSLRTFADESTWVTGVTVKF